MHRPRFLCATGLLVAAIACEDQAPTGVTAETALGDIAAARTAAPAPAPLVAVGAGAQFLTLWPFTAGDAGAAPTDPVNLLFVGSADPRSLRAAFMLLDGDRTAFGLPPVFPFTCTWSDAIGGVQMAYAEPGGWQGSAVQLECGGYQPIRFHLRLFRAGGWTIGAAHFEVLIPGTTDHQVLSWELAEQLVAVDLLRSGILEPALPLMPSEVIHPAPFREIPAIIYNGLPVELKALIGGTLGPVAAPVPIATDGRATVFMVAASVAGQPGVARESHTLTFDQVIPKPFCASGPFHFLYVNGPVRLTQTVVLSAGGTLVSHFEAVGHLDVTPVNPLTSPPTPVGETYRAEVREHHQTVLNDRQQRARSFTLQLEVPPRGSFRGRLRVVLDVTTGGTATGDVRVECLP
jgi:hypothetical protein